MSPFEHHSNLLPWRDIGAEAGDTKSNHSHTCQSYLCLRSILQVVWIAEDVEGNADIADLEQKLLVSCYSTTQESMRAETALLWLHTLAEWPHRKCSYLESSWWCGLFLQVEPLAVIHSCTAFVYVYM